MGRQYDLFAQSNPRQAIAHITELNEPGCREDAWDLRWVPSVLRPRIARVSSVLVLELCRMPGDPQHDPALMDVIMRAAIVAARIVAHSYSVAPDIPTVPLQGHLEILAKLLHRLTQEKPEELETLGQAHATAFAGPGRTITACLPLRVRNRLVGLAHLMAGRSEVIHQKIGAVVFTIGAVAAETFGSLDFSDVVLLPRPSTL